MNSKDLTVQNKLIIIGLTVSTLLIFAIAGFAITKIQQRLADGYTNFGQILTKTLAIESFELTKDYGRAQKQRILKAHARSIMANNTEISLIEFKDDKNIVYSTKENFPERSKKTKIIVDSPIVNPEGQIIGSVLVGFSGDMISSVTKTTKNSMSIVFTLAWLVFTVVVIVNTFLITRELRILHNGVKAISGGAFGTTLNLRDASGEIKELFNAFNDMSVRLHAYEEQNVEQLTVERNKLEAILMSIANGVVVCDNYDNVIMVNNFAQQMLEVKDSEILGTKIQNYYDSEGTLCFKPKIVEFKASALESLEKKPIEFNIEVDQTILKAIMSPIFSKSRDYLGYIIVLIDITKEAQIDKLKSDFISNVSHELRTPVTILRSYAETLYTMGDEFDKKNQKEFIEIINTEVIRLNNMVNDILDFSRLESPNVKILKHPGNIMETIERTVESVKVLAQQKNITFSIIKEPDLPKVSYNEESIERVMNNLLSNAIKYSPKNSKVKIRAEVAKNPEFVEVTVEDNGIGIAPEHLDKIFDRFYRIENDSHQIKGTGLGLHLVKIAVEKHHNGEIFVNSKPAEGSTFGFRIPIQDVLRPDITNADAKEADASCAEDRASSATTADSQKNESGA